MKLQGQAKMLRIYFGEDDTWHDRPLYRAIVERCLEFDIAGATVLRGIAGYGASTLIHRKLGFGFSADAPIVVQIVDTDDKIQRLLPALENMLAEGLIAISDVEMIRYVDEESSRSL